MWYRVSDMWYVLAIQHMIMVDLICIGIWDWRYKNPVADTIHSYCGGYLSIFYRILIAMCCCLVNSYRSLYIKHKKTKCTLLTSTVFGYWHCHNVLRSPLLEVNLWHSPNHNFGENDHLIDSSSKGLSYVFKYNTQICLPNPVSNRGHAWHTELKIDDIFTWKFFPPTKVSMF